VRVVDRTCLLPLDGSSSTSQLSAGYRIVPDVAVEARAVVFTRHGYGLPGPALDLAPAPLPQTVPVPVPVASPLRSRSTSLCCRRQMSSNRSRDFQKYKFSGACSILINSSTKAQAGGKFKMLASSRSDPFMRSFISASFAWSSRSMRRKVFSVNASTVVSSAIREGREETLD
jgi:hypothetical protein